MLIIGACSHAWEKGLINKIFRVCQMGLVILCLDVCGHIPSLCNYFGKSMISLDNIECLPLCTRDCFIHVVLVLFDVSRWSFEIVKHIMFWCQRFLFSFFQRCHNLCAILSHKSYEVEPCVSFWPCSFLVDCASFYSCWQYPRQLLLYRIHYASPFIQSLLRTHLKVIPERTFIELLPSWTNLVSWNQDDKKPPKLACLIFMQCEITNII